MFFKHQHTALHSRKFTVIGVYNLWLWFTDVLCMWHLKNMYKLCEISIDTIKIDDTCNYLQNRHVIGKSCIVVQAIILSLKIKPQWLIDYLSLLKNFHLQDAKIFSVTSHCHPFVFIHAPLFPLGITGKGQGRLISPQLSHRHSAPFGLPYKFSPCMLQIWKKTNFWAVETKKLQFPCLSPWPVMK